MRRSIFDLMNDKEIDVQREYIRLHKLFEEDGFHGMYESTKITGILLDVNKRVYI